MAPSPGDPAAAVAGAERFAEPGKRQPVPHGAHGDRITTRPGALWLPGLFACQDIGLARQDRPPGCQDIFRPPGHRPRPPGQTPPAARTFFARQDIGLARQDRPPGSQDIFRLPGHPPRLPGHPSDQKIAHLRAYLCPARRPLPVTCSHPVLPAPPPSYSIHKNSLFTAPLVANTPAALQPDRPAAFRESTPKTSSKDCLMPSKPVAPASAVSPIERWKPEADKLPSDELKILPEQAHGHARRRAELTRRS